MVLNSDPVNENIHRTRTLGAEKDCRRSHVHPTCDACRRAKLLLLLGRENTKSLESVVLVLHALLCAGHLPGALLEDASGYGGKLLACQSFPARICVGD